MTSISLNIDDLPSDPDKALDAALKGFENDTDGFHNTRGEFVGRESEYFDLAAEYFAIIEHILAKYGDISTPDLPDFDECQDIRDSNAVIDRFIRDVNNFLEPRKLQNSIRAKREKYAHRFSGIRYTFSDDELSRAQQLIYEIREIIQSSQKIEEHHRRRILKQLNNLQDSFDKKIDDLTNLYGHIVQLGKTFGRFSEESKPLVDRVRELAGIVEHSQADAEGLPKPSDDQPLLGTPDENDDSENGNE